MLMQQHDAVIQVYLTHTTSESTYDFENKLVFVHKNHEYNVFFSGDYLWNHSARSHHRRAYKKNYKV